MLTKKPKDEQYQEPQRGQAATHSPNLTPANPSHPTAVEKRTATTRVTVKFDVGFGNILFIRGKGASLSWDKGVMLRNSKPDEWVWETNTPFSACEFKVLINDSEYEIGDNHPLTQGASIQYTPKFNDH